MLVLELKDPNSAEAEICRLYWALADKPTILRPWRYSFLELRARLRLRDKELRNIVETNCFAYLTEKKCPSCHLPYVLHLRSHYHQTITGARIDCAECFAPRALAHREKYRKGLVESLKQNPDDKVVKSWLEGWERHEREVSHRDARRFRRGFLPAPIS
jgi:hypothetical protein